MCDNTIHRDMWFGCFMFICFCWPGGLAGSVIARSSGDTLVPYWYTVYTGDTPVIIYTLYTGYTLVTHWYSWPGALIGGSDRGSHTVIGRGGTSHAPPHSLLSIINAGVAAFNCTSQKWVRSKMWTWDLFDLRFLGNKRRPHHVEGWIHFIVFYEEVKRGGWGLRWLIQSDRLFKAS